MFSMHQTYSDFVQKRLAFYLACFALVCAIGSCSQKEKEEVDFLFFNGLIYTADSSFSTFSAIAIKADQVVALGSDKDLKRRFNPRHSVDLKGKVVLPGLIDAHCHFLAYGQDLQELDLRQTVSFDDMIAKTVAYAQQYNPPFIVGRGWNEELWESKTTPTRFKLDALFPTTPVILQRVDGHAVLCNQAALDLAGIHERTVVEGGTIVRMGFNLTGMLIDNAADLVLKKLPPLSRQQQIEALLAAENACLRTGLTCVSDAGLEVDAIQLIDSLHKTGDLKIRVYAMANPDTTALKELLAVQKDFNPLLTARSVKMYCDGAMGSRGALLKLPYCDKPDQRGLQLNSQRFFELMIDFCYRHGLQVNTHCIGDSANAMILKAYGHKLAGKNDLRWRIEHAQMVDHVDLPLFGRYSIIPSVQPTHAISDMYMVRERLCDDDRVEKTYRYKTLMAENGMIAFGTDFPVEGISPFATYYTATKRKGKNDTSFQVEEAVTHQDAILAMTRWAALANFMDNYTGSLAPGMKADLIVIDKDLKQMRNIDDVRNHLTMINGQVVYNSGM